MEPSCKAEKKQPQGMQSVPVAAIPYKCGDDVGWAKSGWRMNYGEGVR